MVELALARGGVVRTWSSGARSRPDGLRTKSVSARGGVVRTWSSGVRSRPDGLRAKSVSARGGVA